MAVQSLMVLQSFFFQQVRRLDLRKQLVESLVKFPKLRRIRNCLTESDQRLDTTVAKMASRCLRKRDQEIDSVVKGSSRSER